MTTAKNDNLAIDTSALDLKNPDHVQLGILAELQALRRELKETRAQLHQEIWLNGEVNRRYLDAIRAALGCEPVAIDDLDDVFEGLEDDINEEEGEDDER